MRSPSYAAAGHSDAAAMRQGGQHAGLGGAALAAAQPYISFACSLPLHERAGALSIPLTQIRTTVTALANSCLRCGFASYVLDRLAGLQVLKGCPTHAADDDILLSTLPASSSAHLHCFDWPGHADDQGSQASPLLRLQPSLLADDAALAAFMRAALVMAQRGGGPGGTTCSAHRGLPGPDELAAMREKLTLQQAALRARSSKAHSDDGNDDPASAEVQAEAAAAAAQQVADRLQRSMMQRGDAGRDDTALPIGPFLAVSQNEDDVRPLQDQLQEVMQRSARLERAWTQGLRDGGARLLQLLCVSIWRGVVGALHAEEAGSAAAALLRAEAPSPPPRPPSAGDCDREACRREREAMRGEVVRLAQQLGALEALQAQASGELGLAQAAISHVYEDLQTAQAARDAAREAAAVAERRAAWAEADAALLASATPPALEALVAQLEQRLARARAAQLQAAAVQEALCPVCWEGRKGLVFGCGHQTCVCCGERLATCPICRVPIALRIKTY